MRNTVVEVTLGLVLREVYCSKHNYFNCERLFSLFHSKQTFSLLR